MDDIRISLETAGPQNEVAIVRVDGVVDTLTASELEKVMNSLFEQKRFNIVVDLGGVDYISSAGWGIFISNIREIRRNAGDIKLARMVPSVYEIFELLEFDSILKAFDNVEKAKGDFGLDQKPKAAAPPAPSLPVSRPGAEAFRLPAGPAPVGSPARAGTSVTIPVTRTPEPQAWVDAVLSLVGEDPFYSIAEIARELRSRFGYPGASWWQVFRLLASRKLLRKKSRFRYQRMRSRN